MAISPNSLNEAFLKEVDFYEKKFDVILSSQKLSLGGILAIDSIPSGYTLEHHKIIVERYKKAGWKDVVWNSDQRDGDWLTFKS